MTELPLHRGLYSRDNKTIFFFSDLQPEGLISSLDHHFPNSHKVRHIHVLPFPRLTLLQVRGDG